MRQKKWFTRVPAVLLATALLGPSAHATTQAVVFNVLNASATLPTPFAAGDNLRLDTLVTTAVGPLLQSISFTVGAGVGSFVGEAAWEISSATGTGPRLIGVNIDLLNAGNAVIASDTFAGTLAGFALSTLAGPILPGSYTLRATGTGIRDSSLDLTLSFVGAIPEPQTYALMIAGLALVGWLAARRRSTTAAGFRAALPSR